MCVPFMQANCRDQRYLKQVEGFLNNKDKFSFTAQSKDDMTKLRKEVGCHFICYTIVFVYFCNAYIGQREAAHFSQHSVGS